MGLFLDASGNLTDESGVPAGRGGGPDAEPMPPAPAPALGPDALLAQLAAQGTETRMVPAFLAADQTRYVDDTGNSLIGAPDENGMAALPINPDGTPFAPQYFGQGPPYGDAGAPYYVGPPPMTRDDAGGDDWQKYKGNATTGGGFWTFDDIYGSQGKPVPTAFQQGSNQASTNNYRLLPAEYRKPNYIMRNGQIIDKNNINMYGPFGPDSMGVNNPSWGNGASAGFPTAWSPGPYGPNILGWPGAFSFAQNATGSS